MNIQKKSLWNVPLFCVISGIVVYILSVQILFPMAIVRLPDGVVTSNNTLVLIIYGAIFVVTLLIGGLVFFRNMTRKELVLSASIVVLYGAILLFIQWAFRLRTGPAVLPMIYLFRPFEWCSFVSQIFFKISDNLWLGAAVEVLTPYLFVLFGKKSSE
jgi:hypothetical protein